MLLSILTQKQTTTFTMETADISTTQESSHVEITKGNSHNFLRYQGYRSLWIHSTGAVNRAYYVEILKRLREAMRRKGTRIWHNEWIFYHDNVPNHAASGLIIDYWNETPTQIRWFGSEWLLVVSENKVCPKGTKISGYWSIKKCDDGTENHSTAGVPQLFPIVAA
jgi:hypothetical protein